MNRLLPGKLTVPRRPTQGIARPRLNELLEGARLARLILLSAPPGFGKTTALVDWLATAGASCAWLSLDESDNDPIRFLGYLWAAATEPGTDAGDQLRATAHAANADPVDLIDEIVARLADRPGRQVLILDDYHVIEAPAVHRAVAYLLEHLPPQAQLAIATRANPLLPIGRLRARSELLELRGDDLRFTAAEASDLLVERMGIELSQADVATLVARTEGWPAALQLAGLSLVGRHDVAAFVRDFAGTHRFILDFITEEVLGRLEPSITEFLLRTSLLERLTGPLCDALTDSQDGHAMLDRLERANLLLLPLDDERRWYRYHRLFADLLRAREEAAHPADVAALNLRAADWYEAQGFVRDAFEHVLRAGDVPRARLMFQRYSKDCIHAGQFATLRSWLDRLPADVVRADPQLSTTYAWTIGLSGESAGVAERLADAEAALRAENTRSVGSRPTVVPTQIAGIRSVVARLEDDARTAIAHAEEAVRLVPASLPPESAALFAGDAQALLGHALFEAGEADRAMTAYRAARPLLLEAGNRLGVADITRNVARLEARRGRLRAALDACDEALADAGGAGMADEPALAPVQLARAEILERLQDPRAGEVAIRAMELAGRSGDVVTLRDARALAARSAARVAAAHGGVPPAPTELVEPLTERELEVLRLVAAGRSNRRIAAELYLALGTVKAHVHAISGKLGAANRVEAVARARGLGLLA